MLVYDQEHVKEMDSKHHPEEFFAFQNINKNNIKYLYKNDVNLRA